MKIILNENGTKRKVKDVDKIEIHDLWHLAMGLNPKDRKIVLELWHLAHDMRGALRHIAAGDDIHKPISTK